MDDSPTLTLVSWNAHQQAAAWDYLGILRERHGVQVALVQEAIAPSIDIACWPPADAPNTWAITVPPGMRGRLIRIRSSPPRHQPDDDPGCRPAAGHVSLR